MHTQKKSSVAKVLAHRRAVKPAIAAQIAEYEQEIQEKAIAHARIAAADNLNIWKHFFERKQKELQALIKQNGNVRAKPGTRHARALATLTTQLAAVERAQNLFMLGVHRYMAKELPDSIRAALVSEYSDPAIREFVLAISDVTPEGTPDAMK